MASGRWRAHGQRYRRAARSSRTSRCSAFRAFARALDEARLYSCRTGATTSRARRTRTHWMLSVPAALERSAFPGFVAGSLGLAGAWIARARGRGETLAIYGGLAALALWASFGPAGGLYSVLYRAVPLFAWLRVPARFGAHRGVRDSPSSPALEPALLIAAKRRSVRPAVAAAVLAVCAVGELLVAIPTFARVHADSSRCTGRWQRCRARPVIEMPFYLRSRHVSAHRNTCSTRRPTGCRW